MSPFIRGDAANGTLRLLEWMAEDGSLGSVVLGMDAARGTSLAVYGGSPRLTWLLDGVAASLEERGLGVDARRALIVDAPAQVFAIEPIDRGIAV